MLQVFGVLAAFIALILAAVWIAVRTNGPAVLDTVDRMTGGSRDVALVHNTAYGTDPAQKLRVFAPQDGPSKPLPILLFMHGGSWQSGDPDDYGFVARALAPQGFVVVLAGYRLGDAGRYPAMLEDTAAAVAATTQLAAMHGADPQRIVLAGHSAGAYNVVQVALEERWLAQANVPANVIRAVVGLAGPYDFFPFDSDATLASFGAVGAGPESQPVHHAPSGSAPMLLVHGEQDTLVKPRNSRALAAALAEVGTPVRTQFYSSMDHNDPLISLASPWRDRRDVASLIASFAQEHVQVSVPVHTESP